MSRSSFPRPEHAYLLHQEIAEQLRSNPVPMEVSERGVDHYRCCYRFGIRRMGETGWVELPIHFQVAARLESIQRRQELRRILELFLGRYFAADNASRRFA